MVVSDMRKGLYVQLRVADLLANWGARVTYLDHVSEIRGICDRLPKDIDVKKLKTACYGDPNREADRKILYDECLKVAAECKESIQGKELEAAAKRILGEGQLT